MTLVPREKVMEVEIEVGSECKVKQGRKVYTGKIAAIGKHNVEYRQLSLACRPSTFKASGPPHLLTNPASNRGQS